MKYSLRKLRMDARGRLLKAAGSVNFHYLRNQTLVNKTTQKVYIATPKCACTSFKASVVVPNYHSGGKALEVHNIARQNSQLSAHTYNQFQLSEIYRNYQIIALWREPTARFRSAIIDKVINLNKNESIGTVKDIMHHVKRFSTQQIYNHWERSIFEDERMKTDTLVEDLLYQVCNGILNSDDYELNPHFASQTYCQRLDLLSANRANYKTESLKLAVADFMGRRDIDELKLNKMLGKSFSELQVFDELKQAIQRRFSTDDVIYSMAV